MKSLKLDIPSAATIPARTVTMSVFFWRLASLSVTVFAVPSYDTLPIFTPLLKTILCPLFAPEVRLKKPPLSAVPGSKASLKSRMIEVIAFLECATATTPVTCGGVGSSLPIPLPR